MKGEAAAYRAALPADEAKARRAKYRKAARQRYKAAGLTRDGKPRKARTLTLEARLDALAQANAQQAWRWWLKRAPNRWMRAYYRALGRPWANPRLTDSQQWRIRYWLDTAFRAKEIEKAQVLKAARAVRIARTDDGTLNGTVIVRLFAEARTCPYCGAQMRSVEKSLDHVVPLSKGGAHSITNVVVCCKPCNTRKGSR